jgi:hypothetical protein
MLQEKSPQEKGILDAAHPGTGTAGADSPVFERPLSNKGNLLRRHFKQVNSNAVPQPT